MASPTAATLTTDTAFEVLAHRHRRAVLGRLADSNGTATFDRLAEALPADANEAPSPDGARLQLHHVHLPKLQEAGLIEYDGTDGSVRYVGNGLVEDLLGRCS